jgi:hypothetical protein
MRHLRCATLATLLAMSSTIPAMAGGDRLFTNRTQRAELQDYAGTPVWELLAACSGFAHAASEYYRGNAKSDDQKRWAFLSLETYSAAQSQLTTDRTLSDETARPLLNEVFETSQSTTAKALAELDLTRATPEVFAAETALLRGTQSRLCIAASLETLAETNE